MRACVRAARPLSIELAAVLEVFLGIVLVCVVGRGVAGV